MAYITTIEDDCDNEIAETVTTHDKYVLPDGTHMTIWVVPMWCWQCRAFTAAESLESAEKMEEAARRFFEERQKKHLLPFEFISREKQDEMGRNMLEKRLHEAAQWRIAFSERLSPARCLKCSSQDFVEMPADRTWMSHPGDASRKVRISTAIKHASMCKEGRLYDTEGWPIDGDAQYDEAKAIT